jgi:hypothetical protein
MITKSNTTTSSRNSNTVKVLIFRCIQFSRFLPTGQVHGYLFSHISYCIFVSASYTGELQPLDVAGNDKFKRKIKNSFIKWYSDELSKGMKLGKAASDVKIDIKLSNIKPIHASWIVAAFQQVKKETLIRG